MKLLIDTGVLGQVCHPRRHANIRAWFLSALEDHEFMVSEVADYELRRELVRISASRSLARLDELGRELRYVPVTTATWRSAANLWAWMRRSGKSTSAATALDGDVLIAAQARTEEATVLTTNPRHFADLVQASTVLDLERSGSTE